MVSASHELNRLRGRPRQSEREVGRDKLIEQSRKVMNLRPRMDIQRREIAEIVGVTPALINYYFPNKWTLLEEASYPFIKDLIVSVDNLLDSPSGNRKKFEALVEIYLKFHGKSGYAMYYYVIASKRLKKRENINTINAYRSKAYGIIRQIMPSDVPEGHGAETVHAMLWSVCECLGRLPTRYRGQALVEEGGLANVSAFHPLVLDLFSRGVLTVEGQSQVLAMPPSFRKRPWLSE
jgi:AcrR family transcriptional regulator